MTERELQELAAQLRLPDGPQGISVAKQMNETNLGMISATIDALHLRPNDVVLEIGHGNGDHVGRLFHREDSIRYYGLELSPLMHEEAIARNSSHVDTGKAAFHWYEGETFPFANATIDKVFSVNTLYFWDKPDELMQEVRRVLQDDGSFIITFVSAKTLQELRFTKYGFNAYTEELFVQLAAENRFEVEDLTGKTEQIKSNAGEFVEREFHVGVLRKLA